MLSVWLSSIDSILTSSLLSPVENKNEFDSNEEYVAGLNGFITLLSLIAKPPPPSELKTGEN